METHLNTQKHSETTPLLRQQNPEQQKGCCCWEAVQTIASYLLSPFSYCFKKTPKLKEDPDLEAGDAKIREEKMGGPYPFKILRIEVISQYGQNPKGLSNRVTVEVNTLKVIDIRLSKLQFSEAQSEEVPSLGRKIVEITIQLNDHEYCTEFPSNQQGNPFLDETCTLLIKQTAQEIFTTTVFSHTGAVICTETPIPELTLDARDSSMIQIASEICTATDPFKAVEAMYSGESLFDEVNQLLKAQK
jgi:hypothetical protein